jgi:dienelactone hydrolase
VYREFDQDGSFNNIEDSIEGDISLSRETAERFHTDDSDTDRQSDSSFDDFLEGNNNSNNSNNNYNGSAKTSRKNSMFREPTTLIPRGYEFKLKTIGCLVYLTYPANSVDIDSYGKIDYELQTKDKSMVVIIPNSKGLSVNNRKLADAYAIRTGCVVAIIDVYFDDPLNLETPPPASVVEQEGGSLISKLKNYTVEVALNLKVNYWLQSHSVFGTFNDEEKRFQTTTNWNNVKQAIEELLTTHEVENSVIIGFSFGANPAARFAIESTDDRIKSVVLVHPLFLPKNALEFINISTLLIVGSGDSFYSSADLEKFSHDIEKKRKESGMFKFTQFKLKPGTPHGFAIAGDYSPMKTADLPSRTCEKIVTWVLSKI